MSHTAQATCRLFCGVLTVLSNLRAEEIVSELPEVVVTATRTARTVDQNLAPVTILDDQEIRKSGALSVPELLSQSPGVDFHLSGGPGKVAEMSLRGTNPGHVLLLVDGIPLGSATLGTASWEYLPLDQTGRIEVVRGPRSTLYGSQAIGGIVQLFTPHGKGPTHLDFFTRAGSLGTYEVNARVSGATEDSHYSLGAGHLYTSGMDVQGASKQEPDADGYRNSSVHMRVGKRFGNAEVDFHVLRAEGQNEFDNSPGYPNQETFVQQVAGVDLKWSPRDIWQTRFSVGESKDERNDFAEGTFSDCFHTRREYSVWQNDFAISDNHLLTLGVDQQDEHVNSQTIFTKTFRSNTGFFIQHQANFGAQDVIVGARRDESSTFGGHTTGNLNYGLKLGGDLRLIAGWGTAFKAPTFNDLYFPIQEYQSVVYYRPNPDLQPETARSREIGLTGSFFTQGSWEIRTFRTNIDHLIAYDAAAATMQNLNRARIDGLETSVSTKMADWDLSTSFSWLRSEDLDTKKVLPERASHTAQMNIGRKLGKIHSQVNVLHQGKRYNDVENTKRLSGYTLIGLGLQYSVSHNWSLEGRVENLTNEQYETVLDYRSPGRTFWVGMRYAPAR